MGDHSGIQWTDATWNPTIGCTRVSAGCDHCYAYTLHDQRHAAHLAGRFPSAPAQYHRPFSEVQLIPARLSLPLRWKAPRRIFVDSMADLFHKDVPTEFIDQVFHVMAVAERHTFQVLTKRPQRLYRYLADPATQSRINQVAPWPLPNVWVGTSVENQEASYRIDWLVKTPAAVRFLSCEPLLGPLDLSKWVSDWAGANSSPDIGWVIVGGESGADFRPLDLDWARSLRDQCVAADVPFFFKQIGGRTAKAGGRELDGRTWDEMPQVPQAA